jgi:hypothetical protein
MNNDVELMVENLAERGIALRPEGGAIAVEGHLSDHDRQQVFGIAGSLLRHQTGSCPLSDRQLAPPLLILVAMAAGAVAIERGVKLVIARTRPPEARSRTTGRRARQNRATYPSRPTDILRRDACDPSGHRRWLGRLGNDTRLVNRRNPNLQHLERDFNVRRVAA